MRNSIPLARPQARRATDVFPWLAAVALASVLAGCATPPAPQGSPPPRPAPPVIDVRPPPPTAAPAAPAAPAVPAATAPPAAAPAPSVRASNAATPRDYRRDAAQHLYGLNRARIYYGRLPPLLYAIGVLQVEVDGAGQVRQLTWMRAPGHAPEVVAEIERTVRAAAPFPAPARMGRVTYTDTWLWDRSGRFQLDTLTEGQR